MGMIAQRKAFYDPEDLFHEVEEKIVLLKQKNEIIDYLTLVPDGEPTLDLNLGRLIDLLKPLGIKIALITNSTFLSEPDVRQDLCAADWVSVKIDSIDEDIWKKIDRPNRKISLEKILDGIRSFSQEYKQTLVTETMLVKNLNDGPENITEIAEFLAKINPSISYLSTPTRPPAEKWVTQPDEHSINTAYQIFQEYGLHGEYLIGYEGNEFAFSGDVEEDLLSITSVHPMREDAVVEYLKKASSDFSIVDRLVKEEKLFISEYNHARFFLRKLKRNN